MPWLRYRVRLVQMLDDPAAWLLGVAVALVALHLQLYWRFAGNFNFVSIELIGWSAIAYSLWCRRHQIVLNRGRLSQFCGWLLIGLFLVRAFNLRFANGVLLGLHPLLIGLAIALLSVGFRQLKSYSRELWLVAVIALPIDEIMKVVDALVNFSLLTAKYAHALMWYLGFLVERQGTQLLMPTGAVDINPGCSGLEAVIVTLKVAVFFLLTYQTQWKDKLFVPVIGALSAFVVNGFRIMLLANLVAQKDTAGFDYWHGDQGAQIFSMISMTIFSSYCQYLIERQKLESLSQDDAQSETPPEALERSSR